MDLIKLLQDKGIIAAEDVEELRNKVSQSDDLMETVLRNEGISKQQILEAKGEYYGVPVREIKAGQIPSEVSDLIPQKSIDHYKIVPLGVEDGVLAVGFVDPENIEARDAVQFIASKQDMPFKIYLISEEDFLDIHEPSGGLRGEVTQALSELENELSAEEQEISKQINEGDDATDGEEEGDSTRIVEDAPVTKIVATVLRYATEGGASDVHIEPMREEVRVRFRVDGVMHTSITLPKSVHSAVVARIKILSQMKLDEKRKPQDGRFSAHIAGRKIDFRVSTFPTYYGEKVVMRILDPEKGVIDLDDLGMSERNLNLIKKAITAPYGMVLISGPTGSGKTTTLYSMLKEVDTLGKNVLSLEDPVEYNLDGVNQSQVHPEIGYTFANGLRTTLRQDPDIIMVGEIRDEETAGLAIQAALTGHLVFSTIHTNSSVGIIPRLVDMGVDPYLIAPTLILGIAQRLVKTLCPGTGTPKPVEGSIRKMIEEQFSDLPEEYRSQINIPENVYSPESTDECPSGLHGRAAVLEVLDIDSDVEKVVLDNPVDTKIFEVARKKGMLTMREDAMLKAFNKEIPFEEVGKL